MLNFLKKLFGKTHRKGAKKELESVSPESEAICPYCKNILKKKPKRKAKCPFCKNDIYVRTKQKLFPSTLLKREDAIAIDWLKKAGFSDNEFINKKRELFEKFGKEPKSTDVIWGLFNDRIAKTTDLHALKLTYYEMALFLNEEGKDFFMVLQQSAKMELLRFKQDGIKKVRILSVGGCESCKQLDGKVFTVDEALEIMPIPNKDCTYSLHGGERGFCRCTYVAEFDYPKLGV